MVVPGMVPAAFDAMTAAAERFAVWFGVPAVDGELQVLRQPFQCLTEDCGCCSKHQSGAHWKGVGVTRLLDLDADPNPDPEAARLAAEFTGTVWPAVRAASGPRPGPGERHVVFPRAFDPAWLRDLSLPTVGERTPGQDVALARPTDFHRYPDDQALAAAHAELPSTWAFENVHAQHQWALLAARYLARLSDSELAVFATLYDSRTGEQSLGRHWDEWYGVIVQLDGAKQWHVGDGLITGDTDDIATVTTRPGDVLLLPSRLPHAVDTPADPGHSRHLALAVCREHPIDTADGLIPS